MIALDTLSASKALRNAGLSESSAEAIVAVVKQSSELPKIDHLATKDDLEKAVVGLKLFVASTVLGGAAMIVLAQIVLRAIGLTA